MKEIIYFHCSVSFYKRDVGSTLELDCFRKQQSGIEVFTTIYSRDTRGSECTRRRVRNRSRRGRVFARVRLSRTSCVASCHVASPSVRGLISAVKKVLLPKTPLLTIAFFWYPVNAFCAVRAARFSSRFTNGLQTNNGPPHTQCVRPCLPDAGV